MLEIYPDTKIYILCAPNFATGGPEALHQLGHHLRKIGVSAYMYYDDKTFQGDPVHPYYKNYNVPFVREVENKKQNLLILPETSLQPIFKKDYHLIRKAIWWLSVTNYYLILKPQIRRAKRKPSYWLRKLYNPVQFATLSKIKDLNIPCIGHSHFSMVHLRSHGIEPIAQISDYMNTAFLNKIDPSNKKEDIIIYNPKKNGEFLDKIIKKTPHLKWHALADLTPDEVAKKMNRAKLYVDFGYHPGKERMPREACLMRCCLIIGKDGSAAYREDMPIPDVYRFEKQENVIPAIIKRIETCLNQYDQEVASFNAYRSRLYEEQKTFNSAVENTFLNLL